MAVSLLSTDAERIVDFVQNFTFDADIEEWFELGDIDNVYRRMWNAQVQTLFPLVVRECRAVIDEWRPSVADAFDYANMLNPDGFTNSYGEIINSIDEMEISTIKFLMTCRREDDYEKYILYIPDESVRAWVIDVLYPIRNELAHCKICPAEKVRQLLMRY